MILSDASIVYYKYSIVYYTNVYDKNNIFKLYH